MSRHIFEAQMHTVGLESHPYVMAYMDAYYNGTPIKLSESFDNTQVDHVSLHRLAMRAKHLNESAVEIYNSELPDVVKAVNLATLIMESPKPKRGQQVKVGDDTFKFVGHSWVQFDPNAKTKKAQWVPVKDKGLKDILVKNAVQDLKDKEAETKRQAGRDAIEKDKAAAASLKADNDFGSDVEWELEQQRQADEYRQEQDRDWADEEQQNAMADQIKQMQKKQQAPEKPDFSQVKGSDTGYQMDSPKQSKPNYTQDLSQQSYTPQDTTQEPQKAEEQLPEKVSSFVDRVNQLPPKHKDMVEKLLPIQQPWSDYVINAILAGDVKGAMQQLRSNK